MNKEELKPCPFCGVNDWQYFAYYSGTTIRQCGECETIVDESTINTRPIEDALQSRIAELEAAQRWIPVSERLPEAYTRVLACSESGYMEVDYRFAEPIVDVGIAEFYSLDNVTHWIPLPARPEVQE